ncbi:MAG: hypothetical protein P8L45_02505 [Longimicrobiales bacterium]|nr:hypothetical protein [Longimicrobiales bacterium]
MKNSEPEVWIVDTITDGVAVLVEASDDDEPALIEMAADLLGDLAIEGAVLVVPLGSVGDPLWDQAERDAEAEKQLRAEAERILKKLKKRDPGGNVSL